MDLQIEKHQKAIRVLEAISECEKRIISHNKKFQNPNSSHNWNWQRIEVNTKIKERLQNYYNNNFKI